MEKTEKAKKIKKTIRNLIVFILLIGLTFYLIFKDQNVLEILNIAVSVKKRYILVAIIAMCLYLLGETINTKRTRRKIDIFKKYKIYINRILLQLNNTCC